MGRVGDCSSCGTDGSEEDMTETGSQDVRRWERRFQTGRRWAGSVGLVQCEWEQDRVY